MRPIIGGHGGNIDDLLAGMERQVAALSSRLDALHEAVKTHWILQPRAPRGVPEGGQWTDSGTFLPVQAQGRWRDPWPRSPIPATFRNQLHLLESRGGPNQGYGARHAVSGALGRYQLTPAAQIEAGLRNADRTWNENNAFGVRNEQEFLNNPRAQEEALAAYLTEIERQLRRNGSTSLIGQPIAGLRGRITLSLSGLVAAGHRHGARGVRDYLAHQREHGWRSNFDRLPAGTARTYREIESRLRVFERVPYRRLTQPGAR